jgi:hypothetical protein
LGKWQKQSQVQAYVGVDLAEISIDHAIQRSTELRGRRLPTRFFAMDCFVVVLVSNYANIGSYSTFITSGLSLVRYRHDAICLALCVRVGRKSKDHVIECLQKSSKRRVLYRHNTIVRRHHRGNKVVTRG